MQIFRQAPNFCRASLWCFLFRTAGDEPPHRVSGLLPAELPEDATEPRDFSSPGGDLSFDGNDFSPPSTGSNSSSSPRSGSPELSDGHDIPRTQTEQRDDTETEIGFDDTIPIPLAEELHDPERAAAFLVQLGRQAQFRVRNFRREAMYVAEDHTHMANLGHSDVLTVGTNLSTKQMHAITKYDMHPLTHINSWKRGSERSTVNMLGDAPTTQSLRKVIFGCSMLREDKARLLRGCPKPSIWSHPPELGAGDKAVLGDSGVARDKSLRDRQDAKCKQLSPLLLCLHALGKCYGVASDLSQGQASPLHSALQEVGDFASTALHLICYDVSELQRDRKTLMLQAYSGVASLRVDVRPDDEATWSLVTGGRVEDGCDILSTAETHRKAHRELSQLGGNKRKGRGGSSGGGNQQSFRDRPFGQGQSRAAKRRRAAKNGGGNNQQQHNNNNNRGGRGRGRGHGRGRGRAHGRGRGGANGGRGRGASPAAAAAAAVPP